jgi:DnaD/phage-associated family protein
MTFTGFSTDRLVNLPPELFTDVLPAITLPSELKLTLHVFYRLNRQRGNPRRISWGELANDRLLAQSLRSISELRPLNELLEEGLNAALKRQTLLHLALPGDGRTINWYLVHTEANRQWAEQLQAAQTLLAPNEPVAEQQPGLIRLYEQNIGLVTPMLVEELREAEERYPPEWIAEAMREAVHANARSWRYIRKVLERWATHGRIDATDRSERPIDVQKYLTGPHGHLFQRGGSHDDAE